MADDENAALDLELGFNQAYDEWRAEHGYELAHRDVTWAADELLTLEEFQWLEDEALLDEASIFARGIDYYRYLETRTWKVRAARAKRWGICARCGLATDRLDAHHLTYDRLGDERQSDIVALCRSCHAHEHRGPRF